MCGIVAIVDFDERVRMDMLDRMTNRLSHRGPDSRSTWISETGDAGLGHTRLAIIDLETGDQPIHSIDKRYSIVLNGEIYNYKQLRSELDAHGVRFRTESDTEVLLQAYIVWGVDCLKRFNGMFAFAIFDAREQSLFVARDRTGIKPLYLYSSGRRTIAASELKALLECEFVPRQMNPNAVADLLTLSYCLLPATFYKDIVELEPGAWRKFSDGVSTGGRFWNWERGRTDIPYGQSVTVSKEALVESVSDHLVADVPVGSFLSSGVDSSLITAIAKQELGYELQTFTIGFEFEDYDESASAELIARHLGTDHHTLLLSPANVDAELVYKVLSQFDQPFGDSSAIPSYLLSQLIASEVKVVLSGDGGDEMFGGYPRFYHADLTQRLNGYVRPLAGAAHRMNALLGTQFPRHHRAIRRMLNATIQKDSDRLMWFASYVTPDEFDAVASAELRRELDGYRPRLLDRETCVDPDGDDFIDATVEKVLPGDYLRKIDVASSAHGLEVRVPFLGNQVLDLSARLPKSHLYRRTRNKLIPRDLLEDYLPREMCELPKSGFNVPLMRVLSEADRRQLASTVESSSDLRDLVSPNYVSEISGAFVTGRWDVRKHSEFMIYQRFYALLALASWMNECVAAK